MRRPASRVAYLDGIRAIAIGCVLAVHLVYRIAPVGRGGYIGVDVFFVLSGFIITRILISTRRGYRAFIVGRVKRLYPALLVVCMLLPLIAVAVPNGPWAPKQSALEAIAAAFQLSSFWLSIHGAGALGAIGITWSLACEWYFYLLWPLVVTLARGRRIPAGRMARGAALSAVVLWFVAASTLDTNWFYFGPVARFGSLVLGGSVAYFTLGSTQTFRAPSGAISAAAAAAVAIIAAWTIGGPDYTSSTYRWLGFPLIAACAAVLILVGQVRPNCVAVRWLSWKPLTELGLISYSLYLWHYVPISAFVGDAFGTQSKAFHDGVAAIVTVAAVLLSYFLLERHSQRSASNSLVAVTPTPTAKSPADRTDIRRGSS